MILDRNGLVFRFIPPSEGLELLKMQPTLNGPQAGQWVQVLKKTYKGDVGYVLSTTSWGVELLLIPRLSPDVLDSKRKRSRTRADMARFDYETIIQLYHVKPALLDDNVYSFKKEMFEHGLIVKSYTFDSVSTPVSTIPLKPFCLFRASNHPKLMKSLSTFPRPLEWRFAEGDEVYIVDGSYPPSYKSGTISTLQEDSAELATDEGIICVRLVNVCKVIRAGDYVEVTGGIHKGQKGWVVNLILDTQVVEVVRVVDEEKPIPQSPEMFEVPANLLVRLTVPYIHGKQPGQADAIPQPERVPWIGTNVMITRGNMNKGSLGIVKDVLCHQSTPSGLRLVIQLTALDSTAPFRQLTVDYDHVLEAR